jgi:hypothetical protein
MTPTDRRSFLEAGCACGLALLAAPAAGQNAPSAGAPKPGAPVNPVSPAQVMDFLKSIDQSGDEALRATVFERWGSQCFYSRKLDQWALRQRADFDRFLAWVNEGNSRFWERLEYDKAAGRLKLTGRKTSRCACAWAQCPEPPKALCTHCCRAFQIAVFGTMLNRKVDVEVTEALLLGGERCSTMIRVLPS